MVISLGLIRFTTS